MAGLARGRKTPTRPRITPSPDEYTQRIAMMEEAMDVLNERERDILTQRRLQDSPVTLEDLSGVYNVSRERIRQIEVRAFEKLQKRMRELAKEQGMLASPDWPRGTQAARPFSFQGGHGDRLPCHRHRVVSLRHDKLGFELGRSRRLELCPQDHGSRDQRRAAIAVVRRRDPGQDQGRALRRPRPGPARA
jgi:hypothetical protein